VFPAAAQLPPGHITPGESTYRSLGARSWAGSRAGLETAQKKNHVPLPGIEKHFLGNNNNNNKRKINYCEN